MQAHPQQLTQRRLPRCWPGQGAPSEWRRPAAARSCLAARLRPAPGRPLRSAGLWRRTWSPAPGAGELDQGSLSHRVRTLISQTLVQGWPLSLRPAGGPDGTAVADDLRDGARAGGDAVQRDCIYQDGGQCTPHKRPRQESCMAKPAQAHVQAGSRRGRPARTSAEAREPLLCS